MEEMISFEVKGSPLALKRHRTFRKGNFTGTYDPSKNEKSDFLAKVQQHAPDQPWTCPIHMMVTFDFDRPKSHFGTGKNAGKLKANAPMWHTKTPDLDNLVKFICDAMNKVFFKDDSQICLISMQKRYSATPRTVISIMERADDAIGKTKQCTDGD